MPSFDIVSKTDVQAIENAVNVMKKEIQNRYDFHGSETDIELNKKENSLTIITDSEMRVQTIEKILLERAVKQHVDPQAFDFGKEHYASGNKIRKDVSIKQGIEKELAKKIVKDIKESKLKVQASIMDDMIRVTGKKIDDLQEVIALCRTKNYGLPLQYINMKS
jgi:cyclic-di-GMP-binding protein